MAYLQTSITNYIVVKDVLFQSITFAMITGELSIEQKHGIITYTHSYIHTYIHTYTHTYMHT